MIRSSRRNRRQLSLAVTPPTAATLFSLAGWSATSENEANTQLLAFAPDPITVGMADIAETEPTLLDAYGIAPSTLADAWIQESTGVATLFAVFRANPFIGGAQVVNAPYDPGMRGINGEWIAPGASPILVNAGPTTRFEFLSATRVADKALVEFNLVGNPAAMAIAAIIPPNEILLQNGNGQAVAPVAVVLIPPTTLEIDWGVPIIMPAILSMDRDRSGIEGPAGELNISDDIDLV
jgi:hypothetical protein